MTNDSDDDLPPLPEDVGVDVLTARMERLEDTILRGVSRIEQLEASVTQQTATIDKSSGLLERQVHRFTVHSLWSFGGGIFLAALALLAVGVAIGQQWGLIATDRKSTRLNSSHLTQSRMPSSA